MPDAPHSERTHDLLVIGGGINGAGVACGAAACGLSTVLLERGDIASGTSSRSSKLIHGGLRYLEYFDFKLVRESLAERELLMKMARHITWPLRFVMPVTPAGRPAWLLRIGLFLYDHLAPRRRLKGAETLRLAAMPGRMGFETDLQKAFAYSDCWVDDARLVIANLQSAKDAGADIRPRTKFNHARREDGAWTVSAFEALSGKTLKFRARIIINAAGPWAVSVAGSVDDVTANYAAKLVRGSHIIVPKLYDGPQAAMLQIGDGRIVVTMPYETDYTLIGTTDELHEGDPNDVVITAGERDYLLAAANRFFQRKTELGDIVWTYAGVRPLFEEGKSRDGDPTTVTRDYAFKIDRGADGAGAPFLTILGGKLTTHRRLAEHALRELAAFLPSAAHTAKYNRALLPGAAVGEDGPWAYVVELRQDYPWLSESYAQRLARTYGSLSPRMLGDARSADDLGFCFGDDLYQREVDYLIAEEWALEAEDVLWRRTKCGLRLTAEESAALSDYMAGRNARDTQESVWECAS